LFWWCSCLSHGRWWKSRKETAAVLRPGVCCEDGFQKADLLRMTSPVRSGLAVRFRESYRWAAPIVFGPRTLGRTWGTRPISGGSDFRWVRLIRRVPSIHLIPSVPFVIPRFRPIRSVPFVQSVPRVLFGSVGFGPTFLWQRLVGTDVGRVTFVQRV